MKAHRRPGPVRHESDDVRHWPLIITRAILFAGVTAGTALTILGGIEIDPDRVDFHGRVQLVESATARGYCMEGLFLIGASLLMAFGVTWGYGLALYGKKLPLEIKVDEVALEVGELGHGLGRIESALTDAVAGEVAKRGARHRRERWLHSVR